MIPFWDGEFKESLVEQVKFGLDLEGYISLNSRKEGRRSFQMGWKG